MIIDTPPRSSDPPLSTHIPRNQSCVAQEVTVSVRKNAPKNPKRSAPPFLCSHFSFALSAVEPGKAWRIARSAPHGWDSPGRRSCPHYSLLKRIEPTESSRCGGHDAYAPPSPIAHADCSQAGKLPTSLAAKMAAPGGVALHRPDPRRRPAVNSCLKPQSTPGHARALAHLEDLG